VPGFALRFDLWPPPRGPRSNFSWQLVCKNRPSRSKLLRPNPTGDECSDGAAESIRDKQEKPSASEAGLSEQHKTRFFFQLKRFLVFQFKLYVDAFRDLVLSALSLFAFILDVVLMHEPEESLFDKVLGMGRRSERAIKLFNQHDKEQQGPVSIDGLVDEMEERLKRRQP
jgi:hypothetical protein